MLAIDCGNSRLKWGLFEGDLLVDTGALSLVELGVLARRLPQPLPRLALVANVAGARAAVEIRAALEGHGRVLRWVRGEAEQCGVRNGYADPAQLGADRWAALIGARHLSGAACLVVLSGTATTVDVLDADGLFRGGLILPGLEMMAAALAGGTAQLGRPEGNFEPLPRSTADAIASGCLQAQVGAIERVRRHLPGDAPCLLSGGAAPRLAPHLAAPVRVEPHLVLHGLACIAREP
jgi:type III pantothenate kinase